MSKWRKKPVEVEANQWFPGFEVAGVYYDKDQEHAPAFVVTAHAQRVYLKPGDWVIPEPDGRGYYPCKDDIFRSTYDPA